MRSSSVAIAVALILGGTWTVETKLTLTLFAEHSLPLWAAADTFGWYETMPNCRHRPSDSSKSSCASIFK